MSAPCWPCVTDGLVADLDAFNVYGHMAGLSPCKRRSGIKHDCTRNPTPSRYMLVTLRAVGEATTRIAREASKTWDYLQAHANRR